MVGKNGKSAARPSRRSFLAGAAGAAAVAGGVKAETIRATGADRALLACGDALAKVDRDIALLHERCARIHEQVRDACPVPAAMRALAEASDARALAAGDARAPARTLVVQAESALRRDPAALDPTLPLAAKMDSLKAYKAEIDAAYRRAGYRKLETTHRKLADAESDLIDRIHATNAESIAGLVVKLRVADRTELWSAADPADDFDRAFLGATLRDAERLAGMARPT